MEAVPANPPAVAASGDSNSSSAVAGAADAVSVLRRVQERRAKVRCNECGRACITEWSTWDYPPLRKVFWSDRVCCSEACMRSYLNHKCGSASCMDEPQVAQQRKYEAEISIKVSTAAAAAAGAAAGGNGPSSPAASAPPTSSFPLGPPSLLLRQLQQKSLRHYIGTFLPQRCTLCEEGRWVLAKCHSNFEWWCLQCGISMQDSTHNGLPPSDSVHCCSRRGPSSHCEYSSAS
jgi:hypothetical protein